MRIWNVNPIFMCDVHLIAEHREAHMLAGALAKAVRLEGHVARGLIEPGAVQKRHDLLADEMGARKLHHRSPMGPVLPVHTLADGFVCEVVSWRELQRRCEWCRKRVEDQPYRPLGPVHACGDACTERVARDERSRPAVTRGIAQEHFRRPKSRA